LLPRDLMRRVYLDFFAALKNNLILPEEFAGPGAARVHRDFLGLCQRQRLLEPWLAAVAGTPDEAANAQRLVRALIFLYLRYCAVLSANNRIDVDDQKLFPYVAFDRDPALLAASMAPYRCVIVDEFQDINRLDFELICLLAGGRQLIVVGDDDQAIYGFRGCSPDYIIDFAEHSGREVETHVLGTNYRCPRNVVAMSSRLIAHNTRRVPKQPAAGRADDALVQVWHCVNAGSEAQVIARFLRRAYAEQAAKSGFRYADVAILTRMNSQSRPLQIALILEEVPYHCRREENILLSESMVRLIGLLGLHLRLRDDPAHADFEDTRLLCESFFRYQRPERIGEFHRLVERRGGYRAAAPLAARHLEFRRGVTPQDFARAVEVLLREEAKPAALVERIGSHFKHLGGLIGSLEEALDNALPLGEFVYIASRFRGDVGQFHELLGDLLARVQGGLFVEREREGDAVNMLTYFRAKGRQWHTVIVPGANQKVIPHARAPVEDERRLFYVAVTRATANLVFSYVRQAVRSKVEPSQFLAELGLDEAEEKRATFIT
jgi:DNA helicase-2/ATP-dependent DNA helicase PcrA